MNTETIIVLAVYATLLLGIFGFLGLLYFHIKKFQQFSPKILPVFRGFLIFVVIVAIFGLYKILTNSEKTFTEEAFDISEHTRLDF